MIFKIITLIIIPVITRNIAMNYTTGYIGIKPNLIFRFATELYIYLVPIVPDLGEYFDAMINIGLPVVFYVLSYRIIDDHINGIEYDFKKNILRKTFLAASLKKSGLIKKLTKKMQDIFLTYMDIKRKI